MEVEGLVEEGEKINLKAVSIGTSIMILLGLIVSYIPEIPSPIIFIVFFGGGMVSGWTSKAKHPESGLNGGISGFIATIIIGIVTTVVGFQILPGAISSTLIKIFLLPVAATIMGAIASFGGSIGGYIREKTRE